MQSQGTANWLAAHGTHRASLRDYLSLARFDHITKHVFIIPGAVLADTRRAGHHAPDLMFDIVIGTLSAIAIASANYVINEWLDRTFDAHHPVKSQRMSVQRRLEPIIVYLEYLVLAVVGMLLARSLSSFFFLTSAAFVLSGLIYNVAPIRTKDRAYLDVISESINNPIRLTLGWTMIDPTSLPPSSLLVAYWMGGAFLMAAKRLSEYRDIAKADELGMLQRYRRSFATYTADSLSVSCMLYAMMSGFFVAVFLIKYRVEYILALPLFAILFALYYWLSLRPNSIAQRPERLFRSRRLVAASVAVAAALLALSFIDVPGLETLSEPSFSLALK